jgi:hypothetical protein
MCPGALPETKKDLQKSKNERTKIKKERSHSLKPRNPPRIKVMISIVDRRLVAYTQ